MSRRAAFAGIYLSPIGTETPTNFPFCRASVVFGTKFPRMIPMAMARNIQIARKRSRKPMFLKAVPCCTAFSSSFLTSAAGSVADSRSGSGVASVGGDVCFSRSKNFYLFTRRFRTRIFYSYISIFIPPKLSFLPFLSSNFC